MMYVVFLFDTECLLHSVWMAGVLARAEAGSNHWLTLSHPGPMMTFSPLLPLLLAHPVMFLAILSK